MLAVGFRHSTCVSRPAGAASRLVGLQTPPSTYSRPPIVTGANSHGTAQDASTASATVACGAPGQPNTTRRPLRRSTARRAAGRRTRGSRRLDRARAGRRASRSAVAAPRSSAARTSAPPGAASAERQRRERGADGERPFAGAAGGGESPAAAQAIRRAGGAGAQLEVGPIDRRPPRRLAGDQVRGDDRAGRRADEVLAVAQVEAGRRPRSRRARPSSRPRRGRRRRRARARRGGRCAWSA